MNERIDNFTRFGLGKVLWRDNIRASQASTPQPVECSLNDEALLDVLGIRDILVKNDKNTGHLGEKLMGYWIFKKEIRGYRT